MKKNYTIMLLAFIATFMNLNAQETAPGCGGIITDTDPYWIRYVNIGEPWPNADVHMLGTTDPGNDGGYEDYTAISWNAAVGTTYDVIARAKLGIDDGVNPTWWKLWIDFNKDGDYDDAGELLVAKTGSAFAAFSFNLPSETATGDGAYIMRIAVSSSDFTSSCDITVGEIEDYTVNITGLGILSVEDETIVNLVAYPNPVSDKLKLTFGEEISSVTVYSVLGSVIYEYDKSIRRELQIDTESWESGLYLVNVKTEKASQTLKVIKE